MRATLGTLLAAATLLAASAPATAADGLRGPALLDAFRAQGMTLSAPSDQPVVLYNQSEVYGGLAVSGARGGAVLVQEGGHPCQYTVMFDVAKISVAFNRSYLKAGPNGITHPVWKATAYDANGRQLSQVGEERIASYQDVPDRRFTLTGPGISRIVFWGDDHGVDGFCNVVVDTMDTVSPS
jgi:hypothetical protein